MRKLALLILLLCPGIASAVTPQITVSASAVTLLGGNQTISITVTLIDPHQTGMMKIANTNIIPPGSVSTVTPGSTATVGPIWGSDVIVDAYGNANQTYYRVSVFLVSNGIVASTPVLQNFYQFAGSGTVDLSTATPLAPSFFTGPSGNVSMPGSLTVAGQIISTVATGTAPVSIASTTVVPNLNAQLHNGLTAPASAIVGISDTQVLSNKTIDCTANTLAKNPCVVYSTASSSTNVNITATTMATAGGGGNTYRFGVYLDQTVLGASCATNTTVTVSVIFTDPNTSSTTTSSTQQMTIVTNGSVGTTNSLFNFSGNQWLVFRAKASTTVQYSTTVNPGGSCSPVPSYQVYPILEQLQ